MPSHYIKGSETPPLIFLKRVKDLKDENRIVEEILQMVGLEPLGSTTPKGCRTAQLTSIKANRELTQRRLPGKKEIKEAPIIKLGSQHD